MVQKLWENIPDNAHALFFPKLIELLSYDRYFLKTLRKRSLGYLNTTHHDNVERAEAPSKTSPPKGFLCGKKLYFLKFPATINYCFSFKVEPKIYHLIVKLRKIINATCQLENGCLVLEQINKKFEYEN